MTFEEHLKGNVYNMYDTRRPGLYIGQQNSHINVLRQQSLAHESVVKSRDFESTLMNITNRQLQKQKRPNASECKINIRSSCPNQRNHPKKTASRTMVRMTARISSRQQALLRAFFWYLAALLSS